MSILDLHIPEWHQQAACAQIGIGAADDWFPTNGGPHKNIRAICAACPTRTECFEQAVTNRETGIWGGVTFTEGRTA